LIGKKRKNDLSYVEHVLLWSIRSDGSGQFLPRLVGPAELATLAAGDWDGNSVTLH
jgi:hypothetical protein